MLGQHGRAMTISVALILLAAGIGGGLASTIASVASVVSYPILLALGLPPLAANVTNTMSLVLTAPGSVLGSRPELAGQRPRVLRLAAVTACGGGTGAAILLLAPASAFALVVPVLIAPGPSPWPVRRRPQPGSRRRSTTRRARSRHDRAGRSPGP